MVLLEEGHTLEEANFCDDWGGAKLAAAASGPGGQGVLSETELRAPLWHEAINEGSTSSKNHCLPPPTPSAPCRYLPLSLLDCTDDDDDDDGSPSFHTAASTPAEAPPSVHSRTDSPDTADIDSRAAEFIERFRRNASLELSYCSPVTPARPPASPDAYFNLSRLHGPALAHARPVCGRSSPGARASATSIKWPTSTCLGRRPTVQVWQ
ncbi:hypothetical protein ZWY2020_002531 [Hordeum vulgare]|nr:hypothetical protein ZWY2020_002531 [Hordeum vulgare]